MQIFEVVERSEVPFMETIEVIEGTTAGDTINDTSNGKAFILVDHDTKSIWMFNGAHCPIKVQVYCAFLTGILRQQLRGFYRIYSLNMYSKTDSEFQEIINKQLGGGRAKPIKKEEILESLSKLEKISVTSIQNPNLKKAIDIITQFPQPENLTRRFMIIGGQIFTDEEIPVSFLKEEKKITEPVKLGRLNNGFTFFKDHKYSTRLIIKERKIQGIELFINKDDKSHSLELEIPVIYEEKLNKPGSIETLIKGFKIPDQLPEENNQS